MEIIDYFESEDREHWLEKIGASDWSAGKYLYRQLRGQNLKDLCGGSTRVLLLIDGENLISFCTYAEKDCIQPTDLTPWIGFVYTFPEHRGRRHMGKLLEHARELARKEGHERIYLATGETGLYEKYGYAFWKMMRDIHGEDSRIYVTEIEPWKIEEEKPRF